MPTADTPKLLPLSIRQALTALDRLYSVFHQDRQRNVRTERFDALQAVLRVILRHCDLSREGAVMRRVPCGKTTLILPCTVEKLADEAGLGLRRTWRCLHDLVSTGLLKSPKQERRPIGPNMWQCFTVRRSLTAKFWDLLGLTGQYLHDMGHQVMRVVDASMREVGGFCKCCSDGRYRKCAAPADRKKIDADPPPIPLDEQVRQLAAMAERDGDFTGAATIRGKYPDTFRR